MAQHLTRDRIAQRERRARLIAASLCTACGKSAPRPGHRKCQPCAQKDTDRAMRRFNRQKEPLLKLGLCPRCRTREAMPHAKTCGVCAERWIEYKATLRTRWKAAGLCVWCGGTREREDRTLCSCCRTKAAATHARRQRQKSAA